MFYIQHLLFSLFNANIIFYINCKYKIDRASAGFCKLTATEKAGDPDEPDDFGYTQSKSLSFFSKKILVVKSGEMEEGDQFLLVLFIVFFFFCKLERERVSRRFFSNDWRKRIARLCLRSSFNTGTKANLAGE